MYADNCQKFPFVKKAPNGFLNGMEKITVIQNARIVEAKTQSGIHFTI